MCIFCASLGLAETTLKTFSEHNNFLINISSRRIFSDSKGKHLLRDFYDLELHLKILQLFQDIFSCKLLWSYRVSWSAAYTSLLPPPERLYISVYIYTCIYIHPLAVVECNSTLCSIKCWYTCTLLEYFHFLLRYTSTPPSSEGVV